MRMAGMRGEGTRSTTRFNEWHQERRQTCARTGRPPRSEGTDWKSALTKTKGLFLREIGLGFGQFGPVGADAADLGELGIERLRFAGCAGCLCRARCA
jgi:tRNA G46 methylase TrmB